MPKLIKFIPFDPATKMSESTATDATGATVRVIKGAFSVISKLSQSLQEASQEAAQFADGLEAQGFRVLAVAIGPSSALKIAGLIALRDPPRPDSAALIKELHTLGARAIMLTGDAPATAASVARAVGMDGKAAPPGAIPGAIPADVRPEQFWVLPAFFPKENTISSKHFRKAVIPLACAATARMTAPRSGKRKWVSRSLPPPMLLSRRPVLCSRSLDSAALSLL